jgi:hypothetical protein
MEIRYYLFSEASVRDEVNEASGCSVQPIPSSGACFIIEDSLPLSGRSVCPATWKPPEILAGEE